MKHLLCRIKQVTYSVTLSLITSTCLFGAEADTAATSAIPTLDEAFVEFRVTKNRGSGFYRVMVDEQENPYIDVEEALSYWFQLPTECQQKRQYCQARLQPDDIQYWIDGEQHQLGREQDEPLHIEERALVFHEGRLWLRYDIWPLWLPMNSEWAVSNYTLGFHPHFPLLEDQIRAREAERQFQLVQKQTRDRLSEARALQPSEAWRNEGRYRVAVNGSSDDQQSLYDIDYDWGSDVWEGTFQLRGHVHEGTDPAGPDFWRFRKTQQPNYQLFELGYTQNDGSVLFPVFVLKDAVHFSRLEQGKGAGLFERADWTLPDTEIDVYRNGFLERTLRTDATGFYQISDLFVSGGDRLVLRFYFDDGSSREEVIQVAPDEAHIIAAGQWDLNLLSGLISSNGQRFRHAGVRYGFFNNFSAGIHGYTFDYNDNPEQTVNAELAWRPLAGFSLLYEQMFDHYGNNYVLRADLTALSHHVLRLEHREIAANNSLLSFPLLRDPAEDYWHLTHKYRISKWNWQWDYKIIDQRWQSMVNIDHQLNRVVSLFAENDTAGGEGAPAAHANKIGTLIIPRRRHYIEMSVTRAEAGNSWLAVYRHQGGLENPWDISLSATRTSEDELNATGSLTWRKSRKLSLTLTADRQNVNLQLVWSDIVAAQPGPRYWDEFGTGTLSGRLLAPADSLGRRQPLSSVRIRADIRTAVTDADGHFVIRGIPASQRSIVSVDAHSLDASMLPVEENTVVRFRPGTHIVFNPDVTWTTGMDGYLETSHYLPAGLSVAVIRRRDQRQVATVKVEEDGFFLVEGLMPGDYQLRLLGSTQPPLPLEVTLSPDLDWLSDIHWPWPANRQ